MQYGTTLINSLTPFHLKMTQTVDFLKHNCYGLNGFFPHCQNLYDEILTLNMMILRDMTFRGLLGLEDRAFMDGISTSVKESDGISLSPSTI